METGKLIFKFWFKNGTYIEKEVVIDENVAVKDAEKMIKGLPKLNATVSTAFRENMEAEISVNSMIVRCSELIAFDITAIQDKSEKSNADL